MSSVFKPGLDNALITINEFSFDTPSFPTTLAVLVFQQAHISNPGVAIKTNEGDKGFKILRVCILC
jgi:hypothetical protein